jgi:cysteine-rich repeat protein
MRLAAIFTTSLLLISCKDDPFCGDGVTTAPEACDDQNQLAGDGCENDCTLTPNQGVCGDNIQDNGEGCDDGNTINGDGCDALCQIEIPAGCGDTVVDAGEECDDGNNTNGDGCDNNCTITACGNLIVTQGEDCDDGNDFDGDGCQADCSFTPVAPSACDYQDIPGAATLFVDVNGDDINGDGSANNPFATITEALRSASDNTLILVRPGTYNGEVRLEGSFAQGVTVRSEVPYQAKLRHNNTVVRCFVGQGITVEGFDIAHDGAGAGALVVQIQDLIDEPGGANFVSRITLRNNILHDSFNNDILKINNGAGQITVERNIFYNQNGSDEHMDINSVTDVVVQDNIFFNDFAGSGRVNNNDTSSYIVVKDSNGADDTNLGSERITIRRNVFLHWEGSPGSNLVLLGEDGNPFFEALDVVVENNLMIGDTTNDIRAPFGCKGVSDVVFRYNTIVGDFPGDAFAFRLNQEGANLANNNIQIFGNVFSDPGGTMDKFSTTPIGQTASFIFDQNLYFNGGQNIPSSANELINFDDDASAVFGDPLFGAQAGLIVPRLNQATNLLADGSANSCEAFTRLVELYGTPATGSAAIAAGDAADAPTEDILGNIRPASPALGACEP